MSVSKPSREAIVERYEKFGGIARAVLARYPEEWYRKLRDKMGTTDFSAVERSVGLSDEVPGATHKLLIYDVVEGTAEPCTEVLGRFASEYVLREFSKVSLRLKKQQTLDFLEAATARSDLSPFVGVPFEMWAHELLARGGGFRVRRLGDGGDAVEELRFAPLETKPVGQITDVPGLHAAQADQIYFQPEGKTFAAFDALVRQSGCVAGAIGLSDTVGLQMTVSHSHPLLHARLVEILKHMRPAGSDPFDVFFVVPPSVFSTFSTQHYIDARKKKVKRVNPVIGRHVRQWVLELPLSST